jgi:hypothetical protein
LGTPLALTPRTLCGKGADDLLMDAFVGGHGRRCVCVGFICGSGLCALDQCEHEYRTEVARKET